MLSVELVGFCNPIYSAFKLEFKIQNLKFNILINGNHRRF